MSDRSNHLELIEDAVKNNNFDDVEDIYRTINLEYTDGIGSGNENLLHITCRKGSLEIVKFCVLEKGLDVNSVDLLGRTGLILAARRGHLRIVQFLIERGADIDKQSVNQLGFSVTSALTSAAREGHLEVVQCLVKNGAGVNVPDRMGATALTFAASGGHLQIVQNLLDNGADLGVQSSRGRIALIEAAGGGHFSVVECLMEKGADVNVMNKHGMTALMFATQNGHLKVVEYLLEKGADVNVQDKQGCTPLMVAIRRGVEQVVTILLENGAEIEVQSKTGYTALACAAEEGNLQVVQWLAEKGADLNVLDKKGETPLIRAAESAQNFEVVKYLVKIGADVGRSENDGINRPKKGLVRLVISFLKLQKVDILLYRKLNEDKLMNIVITGTEFDVVKHIVDEGGNEDGVKHYIVDEGGNKFGIGYIYDTLLERYAEPKSVQDASVAVYLYSRDKENFLKPNFDINSKYRDEQTVSMWAAKHGEIDVLKYLIEHGADLKLTDKKGRTALQLAGSKHHFSVVDYLLDEQNVSSEELDSVLQNISEYADDPSRMHSFYIGNLYKTIIRIFTRFQETKISQQVVLLRHIYTTLQIKDICDKSMFKISKKENEEYRIDKRNKNRKEKMSRQNKEMGDKDYRRLEELLGYELFHSFNERIQQIRNDKEINFHGENRDRWLIAEKIHHIYIKSRKGCVQKITRKLKSCRKATETCCIDWMKSCWNKICCKQVGNCGCKLPRLLTSAEREETWLL